MIHTPEYLKMMEEHAVRYAEVRRIVCAAIRAPDLDVIIGIRHFSPDMRAQIQNRSDGEKFLDTVEEGFVDQWGLFLTRQQAWHIALKQNQIIQRCGGDTIDGGYLWSENLY